MYKSKVSDDWCLCFCIVINGENYFSTIYCDTHLVATLPLHQLLVLPSPTPSRLQVGWALAGRSTQKPLLSWLTSCSQCTTSQPINASCGAAMVSTNTPGSTDCALIVVLPVPEHYFQLNDAVGWSHQRVFVLNSSSKGLPKLKAECNISLIF